MSREPSLLYAQFDNFEPKTQVSSDIFALQQCECFIYLAAVIVT